MRGTLEGNRRNKGSIGLIPTYAGNTVELGGCAEGFGAHPHVCGEHLRGAAIPHNLHGLIPTYAGNTSSSSGRSVFVRAHPHVCGEHRGLSSRARSRLGSSPRMRGTQLKLFEVSVVPGLIPTYAGNTARVTPPVALSGAHPHVCGEHLEDEYELDTLGGSSPRMRGTRRG